MEKTLYYNGANKISFEKIGTINPGQDGAICNGFLFRMNGRGFCSVYSFDTLSLIDEFYLDGIEHIAPHSNSVSFGLKASEEDEFPVLYTNVYNNYSKEADRQIGVICAYRITRDENNKFSSSLIQLIKVGFHDDLIWKSKNIPDVRPYGNFVIDVSGGALYIFTMRDEDKCTRFFEFKMPGINNGDICPQNGIRTFVLKKEDIIDYFDSSYINYMQGACYYRNYIYSSEGFTDSEKNPPRFRIFDLQTKKSVMEIDMLKYNMNIEPELVEVCDDKLYYSDAHGDIYSVKFGA